ncbi:hypothetical protein MHY85_02770 [Cellulomonas sp. ACRRI]|uniref:hypothetical protein n=1 Tax=Cellulomonas sp. ACRRI TaxID=2918188 RepID=UPI001EF311E4|nr:hypothetical protein [Cellulomonas sp. ACRRI]MCG7284894.1 hypothetical protein [Cellulomonas sp. ACRRI]
MTTRREARSGRPGALGALRGLRPSRWVKRATAGAVTAALVVTTFGVAQSATPGVELLVNSLETTEDANPGDGLCATEEGACTLRAAIQESNALNLAAGIVRIGVQPGFAGGRIDLTADTATWMSTTRPSDGGGSITADLGAVFHVTAPVEIDLENKIFPNSVTTLAGPNAAVFHVNGPDITLRGVDQAWGGETTFYVGERARDVTITGGEVRTQNNRPRRFLVVRGGATDVTVSDYTVSGFAARAADRGWGFLDGAPNAANAVRNLTISGVTYESQTSGACSTSTAAGCTSGVVYARNQHVQGLSVVDSAMPNYGRAANNSIRMIDLRGATVSDFVFARNTLTNPRIYVNHPLIEMGDATARGADMTNFEITDNVITGVTAASEATGGMIRLPQNNRIAGRGLIARNQFHAATGSMQAIYWQGAHTNTLNVQSSGVTIEDNDFDGWGSTSARSTIRMRMTGAVTIQRNTYGARTGAQTNTVSEEAGAVDATVLTMVNNRNRGANGKMNTWFPTARGANNQQAAPVVAESCSVDLEVAPPTETGGNTVSGARNPAVPARLDVYWTARNQAEVLVDSVTVTQNARQTINVTLPVAGDPRLAHLPEGAALPVDPETGAVSGGLRLQTHDPNAGATAVSSQLSRVATIAGTCRPELSINQADYQNDPTLARDKHWTIRSSLPLVEETVTVDAITLTARPTEHTIDPERINARVVSVEPVEGSGGTEFTVIAKADDSALLEAAIEPGTVESESGWVNDSPADSDNPDITFVNPLVVDPELLAVVAGREDGKDYRITTRPGAPVPTSDVQFTATPDGTAADYGLTLGTPTPTMPAGSTSTGPLNVMVPEGDVPADSRVRVHHTAVSEDIRYHDLVVPDLDIRLFATDPAVEVTKRAYHGVTDSSTPEQIVATGTEAPLGSRLLDGQPVCWVYTVTNVSDDDWATALTDVEVVDTDTRLGQGGLVGVIPTLGMGETQRVAACAVMTPGDTRVAG